MVVLDRKSMAICLSVALIGLFNTNSKIKSEEISAAQTGAVSTVSTVENPVLNPHCHDERSCAAMLAALRKLAADVRQGSYSANDRVVPKPDSIFGNRFDGDRTLLCTTLGELIAKRKEDYLSWVGKLKVVGQADVDIALEKVAENPDITDEDLIPSFSWTTKKIINWFKPKDATAKSYVMAIPVVCSLADVFNELHQAINGK